MPSQFVTKPWSFSARPSDHGDIELVAERETVSFRREMIPDGILAGQMGHLEIPGEQTATFVLSRQEARRLRDELDALLRDQP